MRLLFSRAKDFDLKFLDGRSIIDTTLNHLTNFGAGTIGFNFKDNNSTKAWKVNSSDVEGEGDTTFSIDLEMVERL